MRASSFGSKKDGRVDPRIKSEDGHDEKMSSIQFVIPAKALIISVTPTKAL